MLSKFGQSVENDEKWVSMVLEIGEAVKRLSMGYDSAEDIHIVFLLVLCFCLSFSFCLCPDLRVLNVNVVLVLVLFFISDNKFPNDILWSKGWKRYKYVILQPVRITTIVGVVEVQVGKRDGHLAMEAHLCKSKISVIQDRFENLLCGNEGPIAIIIR